MSIWWYIERTSYKNATLKKEIRCLKNDNYLTCRDSTLTLIPKWLNFEKASGLQNSIICIQPWGSTHLIYLHSNCLLSLQDYYPQLFSILGFLDHIPYDISLSSLYPMLPLSILLSFQQWTWTIPLINIQLYHLCIGMNVDALSYLWGRFFWYIYTMNGVASGQKIEVRMTIYKWLFVYKYPCMCVYAHTQTRM